MFKSMPAPPTNGHVLTKLILIFAVTALTAACSKKTPEASSVSAYDENSASSATAEIVGGALSGSVASGTMASYKFNLPASTFDKIRSELSPLPSSFADLLCPTFQATDASCSASGGNMWLSYNGCSFLGRASWSGVQALSMSSGSATCGSFPNPGPNGTLYRQFVQSSGALVPGALNLTHGRFDAEVDDHSANLANFDNQSISPVNPNGGYGIAVEFGANGSRKALSIARHVRVEGVFDHSVVGDLNVSESVGASSRTVNGTVTVFHNILRIVGESRIDSLIHSNVCCLPIAGSITTTFSVGDNVAPTRLGQRFVGRSETLTFTGCGTAVFENASGVSFDVTLNRCL